MTPRAMARLRDVLTLGFAVGTFVALGFASAPQDEPLRMSSFAPASPTRETIALVRDSGVSLHAVVFRAPGDATGAQTTRYFELLAHAVPLVSVEVVDALGSPVRAAAFDVRDNGVVALQRLDDGAAPRDLLEVGTDATSGRFASARLDRDARSSLARLLAPRPRIRLVGSPASVLRALFTRAGFSFADRSGFATADDLVVAIAPHLDEDVALAAEVRGGRRLLLAGAPGPGLAAELRTRGLQLAGAEALETRAFVVGAHPAVAELHARELRLDWPAGTSAVFEIDRAQGGASSYRLATLVAVRDAAGSARPVVVALERAPTDTRRRQASAWAAGGRVVVFASEHALDDHALATDAGALLVVDVLRWLLGREPSTEESAPSEPPFAPRRRAMFTATLTSFAGVPAVALLIAALIAGRKRRARA